MRQKSYRELQNFRTGLWDRNLAGTSTWKNLCIYEREILLGAPHLKKTCESIRKKSFWELQTFENWIYETEILQETSTLENLCECIVLIKQRCVETTQLRLWILQKHLSSEHYRWTEVRGHILRTVGDSCNSSKLESTDFKSSTTFAALEIIQ